jgi:hypothetical protein
MEKKLCFYIIPCLEQRDLRRCFARDLNNDPAAAQCRTGPAARQRSGAALCRTVPPAHQSGGSALCRTGPPVFQQSPSALSRTGLFVDQSSGSAVSVLSRIGRAAQSRSADKKSS